MAQFRNDFGEERVVPTLGYVAIAAGDTVTVPDDEWHHWEAGGWTALDPDPRPAPEPKAVPGASPGAVQPTPPAPAPQPAAVAPPVPAAASTTAPADPEDVR